jgi:argininosuccinate synthase
MFRFAQTADVPAHIEVAFEQGIPIAMNGIAMSLPELTESLTTIAEDHGLGRLAGVRDVADALAASVLGQALAALSPATGQPVSGVVRMRLHDGEHTIVSVAPSSLAQHP